MGLFGSLFKRKEGIVANSSQMSMEELERIQLALKDKMDPETYNSAFNQACRLIPKGQYAEAIPLFEAIRSHSADAHERGNCENQIGVCHFFLGDYEKAIEYYTQSLHSGYGRDMADDNIWEACEELMKKDGDKAKWAKHYLSLLPNGQHAGKAKKHSA